MLWNVLPAGRLKWPALASREEGECHPEMGAELLAETGSALLSSACPYSLGDKLQMHSCCIFYSKKSWKPEEKPEGPSRVGGRMMVESSHILEKRNCWLEIKQSLLDFFPYEKRTCNVQ